MIRCKGINVDQLIIIYIYIYIIPTIFLKKVQKRTFKKWSSFHLQNTIFLPKFTGICSSMADNQSQLNLLIVPAPIPVWGRTLSPYWHHPYVIFPQIQQILSCVNHISDPSPCVIEVCYMPYITQICTVCRAVMCLPKSINVIEVFIDSNQWQQYSY